MKYGSKVKVMVGFFEGFEGKLINQVNKGLYEVYTTLPHIMNSGYITVREEDLQLIDTKND